MQLCPRGSYCPAGSGAPRPCPANTDSLPGSADPIDCMASLLIFLNHLAQFKVLPCILATEFGCRD